MFAWRRFPGVKHAYDALTWRHRYVLALTMDEKDIRLKSLGFDFRVEERRVPQNSPTTLLDDPHSKGFKYPLEMMWWTIGIWSLLIVVGILSCYFPWGTSELVSKKPPAQVTRAQPPEQK
jgi:hypothetical protein